MHSVYSFCDSWDAGKVSGTATIIVIEMTYWDRVDNMFTTDHVEPWHLNTIEP